MSSGIKSILESNIKDILAEATNVATRLDGFDPNKYDSWQEALTEYKEIQCAQQHLNVRLIEMISASVFIRASIQDSLIASIDATVKPSNAYISTPVVTKTPNSTQVDTASVANASTISAVTSASMDRYTTPRKTNPTEYLSSSKPTPSSSVSKLSMPPSTPKAATTPITPKEAVADKGKGGTSNSNAKRVLGSITKQKTFDPSKYV